MMDTLKLLAPLAWRNLWRNPNRTIITLLVVGVGLYSILLFAALLNSWAETSRETALNFLTGSAQIHAANYMDDPTVAERMPTPNEAQIAALSDPAIAAWVERIRLPAVVQSEYKTLPIELIGVDPAREPALSVLSESIAEGTYLTGPNDGGILLGRHAAERLKTRVGKRVIIMAQQADGSLAEQSFVVDGLFRAGKTVEDTYAIIGLPEAQEMLGVGTDISEISLLIPEDENLAPTVEMLSTAMPDLDVRSWRKLIPMAATTDQFMGVFVYIWLWIMFVLMAIGIVNTQLMAVFERVREFGLLQALGMRPRMILAEVSLESAILMGVGVLAGLVCAILTVALLHNGIDISFLAEGADMVGAGSVLYPKVDILQFLEMSLVVWVLGIIVTLWPARKASHSNPVEAMSHVS